jgi:hypothetical protein
VKLQNISDTILVWGAVSLEGIRRLKEEKSLVIVPEHRPFMLGLKYNYPRLCREGLRFLYCTDNTLGTFFYKNAINRTMVFYKEKKDKGLILAPGSLYAIMLSKLHNVSLEYLVQDNLNPGIYQGDVCILGEKNFVLKENSKEYVIPSEDEFLPEEIK